MAIPTLITSSPDVLGSTPVFGGTRVPVQTLIEYLEGGQTIDDFLEGFPTVTREQVIAFLQEGQSTHASRCFVKLLLDECIDRRLAKDIEGHEVVTVPQAGWASIQNGELLRRAQERFDLL